MARTAPSSSFRQSLFLGRRLPPQAAASSCRSNGCALVLKAKIHEVLMPAMTSTMREGKILSWSKSEGDQLSKGESIALVQSDRGAVAVEICCNGYLAHIAVGEGEVALVGAVIAFLAETKEEIHHNPLFSLPAIGPVSIDGGPDPTAVATGKSDTRLDDPDVTETGSQGRVTAASSNKASSIAEALQELASTPISELMSPEPPYFPRRGDLVVPFTELQSLISEYMTETVSVPTVRVGYTITTTALDAVCNKLKPKGVTLTGLLAKATALALAQHPVVNASCKDGKSIAYNSSINIAVLVAIDGGLITPVLRNADKMDVCLLSRKWRELVNKARTKRILMSESLGETFSITNMGMYRVDRFDGGQSSIMAVGTSRPTVVASEAGGLSVKNQMQVNVSADRRIVSEVHLAAFLQTLARIIEDPKDLTL